MEFAVFWHTSLVVSYDEKTIRLLGCLGGDLLITGPWQPGENPEIVGKNRPGPLELPVLKSFGLRGAARSTFLRMPTRPSVWERRLIAP
jgi:hypothetical protein